MAMTGKLRARLLSVAIAVGASVPCFASGGGEAVSMHVPTSHIRPEPEAMSAFLHGKLGILWPSYERPVLLVAYRQALGLRALSAADEARWLAAADSPSIDSQAAWTEARKRLAAADLSYKVSTGWRSQTAFSNVENCSDAAFAMAAKTLEDRLRDHAAEAAALAHWAATQDSVFSRCDNGTPPLAMPEEPAGSPAWLKHDGAYQRAAALFYENKFDDAGTAFQAISVNARSPWREWAGYLVVRSWWRQTFTGRDDFEQFKTDNPEWSKHPMAVRLKRLQASAKNPEVREAARGLYTAVSVRYSPRDVHQSLWRRMNHKQPPADMDQWVSDVRWLWAMLKSEEYADDWLFATRSLWTYDDRGGTPAGEEPVSALAMLWKKKNSAIWLASALMGATPGSPLVDEMLLASRGVAPSHPLYVHFAWQRARLAVARQDHAAGRVELDRLRPLLPSESLGTRQAFDQLEMILAPSLETMSRHLMRKAVAVDTIGWDGSEMVSAPSSRDDLLDSDTRRWISVKLNGQELLALAENAGLPMAIRVQLAGEAWYRGAFLPDPSLELSALRLRARLTGDKTLATAADANAPNEARFLMARQLLLREVARVIQFPGGEPVLGFSSPEVTDPKLATHWDAAPAFHDELRRHQQAADLAKLAQSNETTWMGQQILPWMRAHPRFAEGPAILEKLVYASRYGAHDTGTSRQAFQLLHKQYPNSPEALRTKYFF